ncbi:penicillin-binding protein 1C [Maridesulfovibrio bastinii]|uniref:penicillin-binding protein 1C n=1 Tax=Maridesulfovibrio bastinii TaxID=47157 RepID=UPI00042600BA|nr:penicillin-binding protein 1C [Maridesulfovibrio bastinii]
MQLPSQIRKYKKTAIALTAAVILIAAFIAMDALYPFPAGKLSPAPGTMVLDSQGKVLRFFLAPDGSRRIPVKLDQVSPILVKTLISSEDRWFRYHPGINPVAIIRAAISNISAGEVVSGASTIPMQIVRLCEPRPRTLKSKLIEAFRALQLRLHFTTDELLEAYLNLLPYGGNIVGVESASRFYFGHSCKNLSLAEAALLTTIPRGPAFYDPLKHPQQSIEGRNHVMDQLGERKTFTLQQVKRNKHEPIPHKLITFPIAAPHYAEMVHNIFGQQPIIKTCLDRSLQREAASALKMHVLSKRSEGLDNAACVIIHIPTREIRVMVGSADYFEQGFGGAINLSDIIRSPGSTLKPFLYALAIDRGIIAPRTFIDDIPVDYSGYVPENYDRIYHGRVEARVALAKSLNVPAVRLLAETGVENFLEKLRDGGMTTLNKTAAQYGLPLALGGCGVKLIELVNLYASLADQGRFCPVNYFARHDHETRKISIFSPESAWMVLKMLTSVTRPEMNDTWELTRDMPAAAWKTGTSFGHRDAWAVGVSGDYAIGVWVGNPDGRPRKGISGARDAGPLLFRLLRICVPGGRLPEKPQGSKIVSIKVCAHSHELPGPFCQETTEMNIIPGKTKMKPCALCRQILVDSKSGYMVTGNCLKNKHLIKKTIRTLPPDLARWRSEHGLEVESFPPTAPDCESIPSGTAPKIVSPSSGTPYILRDDTPIEYQKISLEADAGADSGELYWYLDGKLVAKSRYDKKIFTIIEAGKHRLAVSDSLGRTDSVYFTVKGHGAD